MSVLGPISSLPAWAKKYGVRQVIVALPSAAHGVRRRVAEICADAGIEVLTVPSYEDLISGRSALTTIRTIELDDLLGRDPVVLDNAGLGEWLGNRVVMVTGAGGSIGAELCRHIARFRPAKLVLFDLSEAAVYAIQTALADGFPQLPLATVVGDVKHAALVDEVLARERPSVIFHAGAYKHVPLMEETNAWQAVRNNAYGTWVLGDGGGRGQGREVRPGVLRQGGQPDERDGRDEAPRRDRLPEPAGPRHAVRDRALRQRVRQRRQRHPALPRADRPRRAGDRDASRHHALLHVAVRGDAAPAAGGAAGKGRRDPRARHGRAGAHHRSRARHDPAFRRRPEPHPDRVHRACGPGEKLFEELLTAEEATLPTPHPKLRIALSRAANFDAVGQMVAWCERDRAGRRCRGPRAAEGVDSRVHAAGRRAGAADPGGAGDAAAPLPLRAPRRR